MTGVRSRGRWTGVVAIAGVLLLGSRPSGAISLDKEGDIKLGARTYVNARIGTERTHTGSGTEFSRLTNATFPYSAAGHLRQNRFFAEVELKHSLMRLMNDNVGPFALLNDLPFRIKKLGYQVTFRGEGEGLYDWGPKEYSTAKAFYDVSRATASSGLFIVRNLAALDVAQTRRDLRDDGTHRERLFQAFIEGQIGSLYLRFGRQVLSWGETDGFQLLDHINPLDASFGGFLISLDERRVPLDMLRAEYYLGSFGPLTDMFIQGFGAIDDQVGFDPGALIGSAWTPPGLGAPSAIAETFQQGPSRTFSDIRGGGRLVFNMFDATFSLAHYYTYFDLPAAQVFTNPDLLTVYNDGKPCPIITGLSTPLLDEKGNIVVDPNNRNCGSVGHVVMSAPKVQVSGFSSTFAIPQIYGVVRTEFAYFKDEPAYTQGQMDPFLFNPLGTRCGNGQLVNGQCTGGRRLRDSINAVVGLDVNRFVRFINPHQTLFFSTQFFYKHIKNSAGTKIFNPDGSISGDREVLPVPALPTQNAQLPPPIRGNLAVEPLFISQPADQFLQTFAVFTSYWSGQLSPAMVLFYDWGGGFVYQPSVNFQRDPFRFSISYSILDSHSYKGGSGVSLLKDRDNIEFRFEYVI